MAQKSSFTRRVASSSVDAGTRPGLYGQTLISTGHMDLDRIVGGGLPLGSLVLLSEDLHSSQHLNMIKYFMAEGVALGQKVAWLTPRLPPGGPSTFLPAEAAPSSSSGAHARAETEDDASSDLKIAWQYKKYIKEANEGKATPSSSSTAGPKKPASTVNAVEAGIGRVWCRSFDLTKQMGEEKVLKSGMVAKECCSYNYSPHGSTDRHPIGLEGALETSLAFIKSFPPSEPQGQGVRAPAAVARGGMNLGPESVGRLVVQSLGTIDWRPNLPPASDVDPGVEEILEIEIEVLRFMIRLRQALRDARCTALITLPQATFSPSALKRIQHVADCVLSLETLSDDSEVFRLIPDSSTASALLTLTKLSSVGACVAPRIVDGAVFVVRNKRKKITITTVEIDPDAEDKGGRKDDKGQVTKSSSSLDF